MTTVLSLLAATVLAALQLFLPQCGYFCCHAAINCCPVAILAAMLLFLPQCGYFCCHAAINCCDVAILAAMQLFLPPCGYSCCHAAINCCHVDIYLLQCSYSRHHEAILAAMQLFLPPCGYSCFYSFRLHHLVVLVSRPFLLPCSYIPYPHVAKLPCECSPSPASYHERGHFIALSLQPPLSLASLVEDSRCLYS